MNLFKYVQNQLSEPITTLQQYCTVYNYQNRFNESGHFSPGIILRRTVCTVSYAMNHALLMREPDEIIR